MTNSDRFEVAPPPPAPREFQQARAKKTYENILQAAAELYSERGFHAVQTPDIAKRAGISVGGLYRYFKDKHQIFAELVHRILERNRLEQVQMMSELECQFVGEGTDLHDIAERLISHGWALAYRRYSKAYVPAEDEARAKQLGLWDPSVEFTMPWNWRRIHK